MGQEDTAVFRYFDPNPDKSDPLDKIDCVVRAICAATGRGWDSVYASMSIQGFSKKNNWAKDSVWGDYLEDRGWEWIRLPNTCPRCYTAADFARDYPYGTWILGTGSHAVCVKDGQIWDSWHSEHVVPLFAWRKPG